MHLAARLTRGLGSSNIDHRLRTRDFRDASADPRQPGLGISLSMVESLSGALVIGSNLRAELPLLAHRLRKAAVRGKAKISFLDSSAREYRFPVAVQIARNPAEWAHELAGTLAAVVEIAGVEPGSAYASLLRGIVATPEQRTAAAALCNGSARAVWLGAMALRHPAAVDLRALAGEIARLSGATLGLLAEGANAAGAWLAGVVPHRQAGGVPAQGLGLRDMLENAQRASRERRISDVRRGLDRPDEQITALRAAACVVAVTPYVTEEIKEIAHVLLPMASFAETSGSYVNLEGRLQSQTGVSKPPGEARPGWKILRVLGNQLELDGFDYQSSDEVRDELLGVVSANAGGAVPIALVTHHLPAIAAVAGAAEIDLGALDVPMYAIDAVLRRSPALQQTKIAAAARSSGRVG
ncbi:MAG: hypothetical protein EBV76_01630 [Gammaproteobacteria bacterium]|nr:hypothetical protein [Gammaproteobacteria bacterium]